MRIAPSWRMGRPLRRHEPGTYYLVTIRCHQARFFLRPDRDANRAVLEWLARAQRWYPGVRLHAVCAMSNHLHLLVQDTEGELADWACYFLGNLARAINRIRGRTGPVFARRYSAEPVLDADALLERLVYVVTNPVKARLCKRAGGWPGIVLWAREGAAEILTVSWPVRDAPEGKTGSDAAIHPRVEVTLVIDPLPRDRSRASAEASIAQRERELQAERRRAGLGVPSRAKLLRQHWHAAPRRPKRSPRPACHTSDPRLRRAFLEGVRAFAAAFREAAARLREGAEARFPAWSYPPGRPLVRPLAAGV